MYKDIHDDSYEHGYTTGFCEGWSYAYEFGYIEGEKKRKKKAAKRKELRMQRLIGLCMLLTCCVTPFLFEIDIAVTYSIVVIPMSIALIFSRKKAFR